MVRFPSERSGSTVFTARSGSTVFTAAMRELSNSISEQGLIDLPLEGEFLLGIILKKLLRRLGWTEFCSLQIGRIHLQLFVNEECLGCDRITFRLSLRMVLFKEVGGRLDLRICGLRMRVFWIGCELNLVGFLSFSRHSEVCSGQQAKTLEK